MTAVTYTEAFGEPWLYRQVRALDVPVVTHVRRQPEVFPYDRVHVVSRRPGWMDRPIGLLRWVNEQHGDYLPYATQTRVKDVLCDLGATAIHAQSGVEGIRMVPLARRLGCRLLVSVRRLPRPGRARARALKLLWRQVAHVLVDSEAMRKGLKESGCAPERIEVLPPGVPLGPLPPRSGSSSGGMNAVTVARLVAETGVPDLVDAVALAHRGAPALRLDIIGDGPERAEVERRVASAGLEGVIRLRGTLPPDEVQEHLARADLFVLNCLASDERDLTGLPIAILEAMAAGVCVVSTRHGAIPDAVVSNVTGALVEPRDTEGLCRTLTTLAQDFGMRVAFGAAGRVKVEKQFDAARTIARLRELYRVP